MDLLREEDRFSRKAVQQLAMIKEANVLVSMSDNHVSIHDLQTYQLQEKLERTRGATSFAVTSNIMKDLDTGVPSIVSRLAVSVKRKVLLWSWYDMELSDAVSEITLAATVKSMNWATGTRMVVGMDPGFVMVDIDTQEVVDINKPGSISEAGGQIGSRFGAVNTSGMGYVGMGSWVPRPMATNLAEGKMLLAKDVNTLFIDVEGKALDRRQIPWATAPEAVGYSYPYLLSLHASPRYTLDIRNPDTLSLLQSIPLPNATLLHVPQPNISLAHAGKGFLVASDRCVWRMGALDYDSQVDELVEKLRHDEAVSLLNLLEETLLRDKEGRIRDIKMLKAQKLFESRKYRAALDLFTEACAPPARVIALYPRSIAHDLSSRDDLGDTENENEVEQADVSHATGTQTPQLAATSTATHTRSLLGKLRPDQKKAESDAGSTRSGKAGEAIDIARSKSNTLGTLSADKSTGSIALIRTRELC